MKLEPHKWAAAERSASRLRSSIFDLLDGVDTEERCIRHLEQVRWPDGLICIRDGCGSRRIMTFEARGKTGKPRHLYECLDCRYQYSVTTGTIFHNSHLPLNKWFLAINIVCSGRPGLSARDLERELKVSYRTAWYTLRRIRVALQEGRG